jgi:hypothetical protein
LDRPISRALAQTRSCTLTGPTTRWVQIWCKNVLNIESDRRDGGHDFPELELVKDCCLAGGVQADHEDSYVLLAHQGRKEL